MDSSTRDFNPYQPPADDHRGGELPLGSGRGEYWREGDLLVLDDGASLPRDVCIATGLPATGGLKTKKLQWAHPALGVLVLLNVLIYLLVYWAVRNTGSIRYALSPEFRQRRLWALALGIGAPIVFIAGALAMDAPLVAFVGVLVLLVGVLAAMSIARPLRIKRIDRGGRVYLRVKDPVFSALGL